MTLALALRLLHVLVAIWFISGLLGRWIALGQAGRATDIRVAAALVELAARFERAMVIPGSIAVLILGLLTAWVQGQPVLGFLQGASTNWLLVSLLLYLSTLPLIPVVFLPRGARFEAALDGAVERGEVLRGIGAAKGQVRTLNVPGQPTCFQTPNHLAGEIGLPPPQPVKG